MVQMLLGRVREKKILITFIYFVQQFRKAVFLKKIEQHIFYNREYFELIYYIYNIIYLLMYLFKIGKNWQIIVRL